MPLEESCDGVHGYPNSSLVLLAGTALQVAGFLSRICTDGEKTMFLRNDVPKDKLKSLQVAEKETCSFHI